MNLEYFGTNLTSAGHYFWIVGTCGLSKSNRRFDHLPFNCEQLPWINGKYESELGSHMIYNFAGFTIYAISGSPMDKRGGCKSVFFVQEDISNESMMSLILNSPVSKQIVDAINARK